MPFGRLFGRDEKPKAEEPEEIEATPEEVEDGEVDELGLRRRAADILPTGASTGSKRPAALYGRDDAEGPTHFAQAAGCRVIDAYGNSYVDCGMALGAVALGYAEPNVTRAVIDAAAHGNVATLSSAREVEVAERLRAVVPCAELVQFLKTGAEAISAGVRIARAYTGRDVVVASGYFGWLDWASDAAGVPASTKSATRMVPFDDIPALEAAVTAAGNQLAAIVLEPVVEKRPSQAWLERARELANNTGAVLIFDEIKTGFRIKTGGYQAEAKVTPDLAAFGKALANGYPLSAIVGKAEIMEAARKTWISSTLASESTALAAAAAVLAWHEEADICGSLASIGAEIRSTVANAIQASGIDGVTVEGLDPMWFLRFADAGRETRFLELAAKNGVLFKRGAYNYAAMSHDEEALADIESAASDALVELQEEEKEAAKAR